MKTLIIAIAAFAMIGLTTTTVYAQSAETPPSMKVFYGYLNLHSPDGAKTLNRRIHNAARTVCGGGDFGADGISRNQHCLRVALTGAMKQVPDTSTEQVASR